MTDKEFLYSLADYFASTTTKERVRALADRLSQPVEPVAFVAYDRANNIELHLTDHGYLTLADNEKLYTAKPFPAGAPAGAPEWRSVKDSLPVDDWRVLIYRGESEQGTPIISTSCRWRGDWVIESSSNRPTHWMPLPAAPAPQDSPAQGE